MARRKAAANKARTRGCARASTDDALSGLSPADSLRPAAGRRPELPDAGGGRSAQPGAPLLPGQEVAISDERLKPGQWVRLVGDVVAVEGRVTGLRVQIAWRWKGGDVEARLETGALALVPAATRCVVVE